MKPILSYRIIPLFIVSLVSMISCSSNEVSETYVYICKSSNSYTYHYSPNCRGLRRCSTDLEKLTVKEAVEKGRKLCGYED